MTPLPASWLARSRLARSRLARSRLTGLGPRLARRGSRVMRSGSRLARLVPPVTGPSPGPARVGPRRAHLPGWGPAVRECRAALSSCRVCLSLFTVIPVGRVASVGREEAARAILWLPAAGLLVAVPAAGLLAAVGAGGHSAPRELLAATLAVAALGVLTGGLHLDGLADTADGLGSRRPREAALAIMRRSDVGPFGIAVLVFVLLVQVTALATVGRGWPGAAALVIAVVSGRVAVVLATGPSSRPARPEGFGALVAAATSARARAATLAALLAVVLADAALAGGLRPALASLAAVMVGLLAADQVRRAARRRLGGLTGDIYGAIAEVCTATVLLALALAPGLFA